LAYTRHDAAAEIAGRHVLGKPRTQPLAERTPRFDLGRQYVLDGQTLLEASSLNEYELAIEIGVEEQLVLLGVARGE
jgi:hypothetical protein